MKLMLDAWLERSAPYLQIVDTDTRTPVARFESTDLLRLFTEGVINPNDLYMRDLPSQLAVIQELLLAACCCRIRGQGGCDTCNTSTPCPYKNPE